MVRGSRSEVDLREISCGTAVRWMEDRSYPGKGGVWEEEEQERRTQSRTSRPRRPKVGAKKIIGNESPTTTTPGGGEVGEPLPPPWEGGRDRHGGPGLDKRRAERLPRMLSHQPTGPVEERVREEKREEEEKKKGGKKGG